MSVEKDLLQADKRARSDALDVSHSYIVQAPAGSGKTELLIQRYLSLLAVVDSPEEVLAITFTRKAAMEMRLRVVAALRSARDGIEASSEHERFTAELARKVLRRDRDGEWRLIESPGRMRVQTVDAFCAGIARSVPLSSGLGGAAGTVTDAEMTMLHRQAALATLDYLASDSEAGEMVERVLLHLDNNTELYVGYVARMLGSRDQWLGITGAGGLDSQTARTVRRHLEKNIESEIDRQLRLTDALLPPICRDALPGLLSYAGLSLRDGGRDEHPLARFVDAAALPQPLAKNRDAWTAIADFLLTKNGDWRKQVTKREGFPPDGKAQKEEMAELLESLRELHDLRETLGLVRSLPPPRYTDEQWQVLVALFGLLPSAVAELRRLFGMRGAADHTEVALAARRALGGAEEPGEIAMMLDYQVRHLLVDEMQDTSIGQYELLRQLTAEWSGEDGRTIFCVGDPMQSIYRFRDAEVGEFLLARKRGIGNLSLRRLTLRRNFRSGENLVHWFNTVFQHVMPLKNDIATGAIAYEESVPVESQEGLGVVELHPLPGADPVREAACTFDVIRKCVDQAGDEETAVLVRSRTQLAELLPLLRAAGVEYRAIEIDRLTDLPEIIDLIALTRALCHQGDRLAWLALIRGPWAGLTWKDIHALVQGDRHGTLLELVSETARTDALSEDGRRRLVWLLETLSPFLDVSPTMTLRQRVEQAWCLLGGPSFVNGPDEIVNVYRYLDTLEKVEVAGTLDDFRELELRLDNERVSSGVSADCRLQIMTMHKAKGLQFDHVVLHGLGRGTRGSQKAVLNWLNLPDEEGRSEMIISPVGPRAQLENDPLHRFIEKTDDEKTQMELDRLLYVACTRARKSLHVVGSVGVTADGESLKKPQAGSLLGRLWPAVHRQFEAAFYDRTAAGGEDADSDGRARQGFVEPVLCRLRSTWQPPAVATLPGTSAAPGENVEFGDEVDYYWVGSSARQAGTIVHRWLHRISEGRSLAGPDEIGRLRAASHRWAVGLGVAEEELDSVWARVERALRQIMNDATGRWILYGEGHCEFPVTGLHGGRIESVVIDRVRIDDDGTHWVIDYKTSTHEGGDLPGFLRQEVERYGPQIDKYARLYAELTGANVRKALYFPLLQSFCEVNGTG